MPGKDGGEVARELQGDPTLRGVPILFFTSLISRQEAGDHECIRGGMRYLPKPVIAKVLVAAVDRILGSQVAAV
jgi:CheY-like chemotaxis protein